MNDTENTAKKVARLLTGKVKESGEAEYGEAGWKALPSSHTMCLSYLCGNHARGLPITQFQRLFQKMLIEKLGAEFADAQRTSGTRARLEKNGEALLRSVCKLAHDGHLCYEKGEGAEIRQWMAEKYPEHVWVSVGRVELSKRQDWCCECTEKVLPLIDPLRDYLVHQLVLDSNVLKDSTLQRLELRQFAAYVHTLAVMWLVVFEELRALTNSTIIKLNPMELPQLCDHLWKFADVLVGPNPLSVMEPNYRPWPKLRGEGLDTKEMMLGTQTGREC